VDEGHESLRAGRTALRQRDWPAARDALQEADAIEPLGADDVFSLADCAWWLGEIDEALALYERAHRQYLRDDLPADAAMAALLLGAHAAERGEGVIGSAWMSRARRLLATAPECAEHGYPLYFELFGAMGEGDLDGALAIARRMQDLGRRFHDPNLAALGVMGEGRALIKRGDAGRGMALLDEAMLAAVSDELHPVWTGGIYCHLMDVCHELMDVQRAGEWTEATERWCDTVAEAVLYRGICRVHRAQVYQRRGAWRHAERLASRVSEDLDGVHLGTVAEAHYELGELQRLRGEFAAAARSYGRAQALGRDPQPGRARLRLAEGDVEAAVRSLRDALADRSDDRLGRVRLLAALVESALAGNDVGTARSAAAELRETAQIHDSAGLDATAEQARGAVLLAEGRAAEALEPLRHACRLWHDLDAPYDVASTRLLLGEAHRARDDEEAAATELDEAYAAFDRLGAVPDARRVAAFRSGPNPPDGLSPREVEVLRLVATGATNQEVAAHLFISDKTVARHLANIYLKLDLSTRSAATAYAFERGLMGPTATSFDVAGTNRNLHDPGEGSAHGSS
jgi:DNA-binding CsgD family transcriptional regulator